MNTRTIDHIDSAYIIERQGRPHVLYAGLLDLAHRNGLAGITTTLIQAPNAENKAVAIVHARASFAGNSHYDGIGDASPASVPANMVVNIIRLAETRAKARALRDALNINGFSIEGIEEEER